MPPRKKHTSCPTCGIADPRRGHRCEPPTPEPDNDSNYSPSPPSSPLAPQNTVPQLLETDSAPLTAINNNATAAKSRGPTNAAKKRKNTTRTVPVLVSEVVPPQIFGIGPAIATPHPSRALPIDVVVTPPPPAPVPSNQESAAITVNSNSFSSPNPPSNSRTATFVVYTDPRDTTTLNAHPPLRQDIVVPKPRRPNTSRPDLWTFLAPITDAEKLAFKSKGIAPPIRKTSDSRDTAVEAYACIFCL
jgi:hypothetical protein